MNTTIAQAQPARHSETIRPTILRTHSVVLMLVALASTANAIAGHLGGIGVYGFLRDNPLAYVGLHQAYLLMLVVAITMWLGAAEANTRRWHVIAILAHSAVLSAVLNRLECFPDAGLRRRGARQRDLSQPRSRGGSDRRDLPGAARWSWLAG